MYITCVEKKDIKVHYFLSEWLLAFMSLRTFFILRAWLNYSLFTNAYSKKLCQSYGFNAGMVFTFRAKMKTNPTPIVLFSFFVVIFTFAWLLRIFEMPYMRLEDATDL